MASSVYTIGAPTTQGGKQNGRQHQPDRQGNRRHHRQDGTGGNEHRMRGVRRRPRQVRNHLRPHPPYRTHHPVPQEHPGSGSAPRPGGHGREHTSQGDVPQRHTRAHSAPRRRHLARHSNRIGSPKRLTNRTNHSAPHGTLFLCPKTITIPNIIGRAPPTIGGGAGKRHARSLTARLANCADEGEWN